MWPRQPVRPIRSVRAPSSRFVSLLDASAFISIASIKQGVKLLGDGSELVHSPVHIEVTRASQSAIKAIEVCPVNESASLVEDL